MYSGGTPSARVALAGFLAAPFNRLGIGSAQELDVVDALLDERSWYEAASCDNRGRGMSDRLLLGLAFRGTHRIEDVVAVIDVIDRPDDHS
jgi:hypothetical protein